MDFSPVTAINEDSQAVNLPIDTTQLLKAFDRSQSPFLAHFCHEILTSVNALNGLIQLFPDSELGTEEREKLEMLRNSALGLRKLAKDSLDIARIDSGHLKSDISTVNIPMVFQECMASIQLEAQKKGIQVSCEMDENLQPKVRTDSGKLRQILNNLLSNAVKFTHDGSIDLSARTFLSSDSVLWLKVEIQDTGIGIPTHQIPHIFDEFSQANDAVQRIYGGTGLGLSICKRLAQHLGGKIGVQSEPGRGSRFWIEIPVLPSSGLPSIYSGDSEYSVENDLLPVTSFSRMRDRSNILVSPLGRILIVDDNPINIELMTRICESLGYRAEATSNPTDAVRLFQENTYSLVLLDCQMPETDGAQVLRLMHEGASRSKLAVPIIAMTAHVLPGEREKCVRTGMADYLPKPIDPDEVEKLLGKWLKESAGGVTYPGHRILPSIDSAVMASLTRLEQKSGRRLIPTLIELFSHQVPVQLAKIRSAIESKDLEAIPQAAHNLRSTSAHLGATALTRLCKQIEAIDSSLSLPSANALLDDLEVEFHWARVDLELERRISDLHSDPYRS